MGHDAARRGRAVGLAAAARHVIATRPAEEHRVSTTELFFDLVFVFTLTQLTAQLASGRSFESVAQVVLIFVVLFWMYGGYAWLANQVPPDTTSCWVLLILGMGAFLVCATAIPTTFSGSGTALGIGYLAVVLVHGATRGRCDAWPGEADRAEGVPTPRAQL